MNERSRGGPRDAVITGIGLVSCLGEGPEAHWEALNRPDGFRPAVDAERFAPWLVHPIVPIAFDNQIPKRGDQRQMEAWQRIGTYAAGLALESAGVKGNQEALARTHMIVAAGGGERDNAVDEAILSALPSASAVASTRKGDNSMNARQCLSSRGSTFRAAMALISPICARSAARFGMSVIAGSNRERAAGASGHEAAKRSRSAARARPISGSRPASSGPWSSPVRA